MKTGISILFFTLLASISTGQHEQPHWCGTDSYLAWHMSQDANFQGNRPQPNGNGIQSRADVVLPLVFHFVLLDTNAFDFRLAMELQLEALNTYFNSRNPVIPNIGYNFNHLIDVPNIRFELACVDPDGNPTHGYTVHQCTTENIGSQLSIDGRWAIYYDQMDGTSVWSPNDYINVWVGDISPGVLGRSSLGGMVGSAREDGIVLTPKVFDPFHSDPNSNVFSGKTFIHEMGHYLGLLHLWGSSFGTLSCLDDDNLDDTPRQSELYFSCSPGEEYISCETDDMVLNYMQYVSDEFLLYFTKDQVAYMHEVLNLFRPSLLESRALECIPAEQTEWNAWYDPLRQNIYFEFEPGQKEAIEYSLFDFSGRLVQEVQLSDNFIGVIDATYLTAGMYVLRAKSSSGDIKTARLAVWL